MSPPTNLRRTAAGRGFKFGTLEQKAAAIQADKEEKEKRAKVVEETLAALSLASSNGKQKTSPPQKSQGSATSPATSPQKSAVPSTPRINTDGSKAPHWTVPTGNERVIRSEHSRKDIIITSTDIFRNRVHQAEYKWPKGSTKFFDTNKFANDHAIFKVEYKAMNSDAKNTFWKGVWVEIIVDIGVIEAAGARAGPGAPVQPPAAVNLITAILADEIYSYPNVYISLVFSNPPTDEQNIKFVAPKPLAKPIDPQSPAIDFDQSPTLSSLALLVENLQKFKNLGKLGIVIRAPHNEDGMISWVQFQHILPFYSLNFKRWELLYQPAYPTPRAIYVEQVAIHPLNEEINKIKKVERARQVAEPRAEEEVPCATYTKGSEVVHNW